jgi:hypothetical protein
MSAYRIVDEPEPSPLAHLVVDPIWPMFSVMFAGPWLAWPWFVFNAWALGAAQRRRSLWLAGAALLGSYALFFAIIYGQDGGLLPSHLTPYGWIALTAAQLGAGYALYLEQAQSYELFQHFGGGRHSGAFLLLLGALLRPWVAASPLLLPLVLR